jgi:hypothetical protein
LRSLHAKGGLPLFGIGNNHDFRVDFLRHTIWTQTVIYLKCTQGHNQQCKFSGKIHPIDDGFQYKDYKFKINKILNIALYKNFEVGTDHDEECIAENLNIKDNSMSYDEYISKSVAKFGSKIYPNKTQIVTLPPQLQEMSGH